MARIEHISWRLDNWGRWAQQQEAGGLGYPRTSVLARLGGQASSTSNQVPINDIEASETDDAVKSLQLTQSHLYLTLQLYYVEGLQVHQVSRRLHKAESTIKRHFEVADLAIQRWLEAKAEARQRAGAANGAAVATPRRA